LIGWQGYMVPDDGSDGFLLVYQYILSGN
jgi:hypothetical protein